MSDPHKAGRALVFDFGRVLFRWRPEVLVQAHLPRHALDAESTRHCVAQVFQGYGGDWGDFDRGVVEPEELVRRIAARTGFAASDVQALVDASPAELEPLPDTLDWIHRLHAAGHPLHFLSNMPAPFAAHLERTHAVMGLFESGVFSSRVRLIKPDPAIFAHAAQVFGRAPQSLMFLDDHLPNIVAAREAGWNAVHFAHAAQTQAEVSALGW